MVIVGIWLLGGSLKVKIYKDMLRYLRSNSINTGFANLFRRRHLKVVESTLVGDEKVIFCFVGEIEKDLDYAYAFTTKRIIIARTNVFTFLGKYTRILYHEDLKDIVINDLGRDPVLKFFLGAKGDDFEVKFDNRKEAETIFDEYQRFIFNKKNPPKAPPSPESDADKYAKYADVLLKYSFLYQAGQITMEEYMRIKNSFINKVK